MISIGQCVEVCLKDGRKAIGYVFNWDFNKEKLFFRIVVDHYYSPHIMGKYDGVMVCDRYEEEITPLFPTQTIYDRKEVR